jgi:hypothetical protein
VGHRQSPTLGNQHADQLPSAGDKCDEFTLFFAGQRARLMALRMQDSGKSANARASSRSVLASLPMARAKSRA